MSVVCQCPSCKAKYQVGDQYAGHTIKCPKCSAAVVVAAVAQATNPIAAAPKISSSGSTSQAGPAPFASKAELPKARAVSLAKDPPAESAPTASSAAKISRAVALPPAELAAEDQDADTSPPADDDLGFLNDLPPVTTSHAASKGSAGSQHHAGPKARPAPVGGDEEFGGGGSSGDIVGDLAAISSLAASSPKGAAPHRLKKKKQDIPPWLIPTVAGVGAVVIVGIALTVYLTSGSKTKGGTTASTATTSDGKTSAAKATPGPKGPVLTIEWPDSQRAGASYTVNGVRTEVPPTGTITIPLAPSTEQYHFRFQRPGFKPQEFNRVVQEDDKKVLAEWELLERKGLGWQQDFDAAQQKAASEHKNVMILFDASDVKESSFASSRFKDAVFKRKEFRDQAEKEYVCVYIDNPKNTEAQDEVEDAGRNAEVTKKFGITVFPTVVVTDSKGRPFGLLEGYKISGINAFLPLMEKWATDSKHFFALLAKFDAMLKDTSPNAELAGEVLDFLELSELDRFYNHTIKKAMACLPKGEGRPVTKDAADRWKLWFMLASRNSDMAKKTVDKFDRWKKTRTFKDREVEAELYLIAASVLARLELRKEAAEKCKEGLALQPRNPMVRALLDQANRFLSVEPGQPVLMPVGSGTGYCIADGNYLLTNHHVIRGAKQINVRLNGETEMYPAKLIADNESGDMTILKLDLPAGRKLVPIPLLANELKIGERVCALGWPGLMSHNITLTFTQGVVSTLPPPDDEEAFIVTDCTVNPGNSGGPLCSVRGAVAGMVTRKSQITSHESSYGMAIPVGRLRKFLAEKLPHDAHMPPAAGAQSANMELSDVAEKVKPSVVYIENIQEVHSPGSGQEQESESGE